MCSGRNIDIAKEIPGINNCYVVTLNDKLFPIKTWMKLSLIKKEKYSLILNMFDEVDNISIIKLLFLSESNLLSLPIRYKSKQRAKLLPNFEKKIKIKKDTLKCNHFSYRMLSITDSKDKIIAPVPCPYNKKYKNFYKKSIL